jgi:hypothetical protein
MQCCRALAAVVRIIRVVKMARGAFHGHLSLSGCLAKD